MASHRKVELAPRMGTAAMPQGRVSIICSIDQDHMSSKSDIQNGQNSGKPYYYGGTSVGVHTVTHHSWVMMRRSRGSLRNLQDEFSTGSGTGEMPSAMVFGDFNGMTIEDATNPDEIVVVGVSQNEDPTEPDRDTATTDPGAITVSIAGITTVQCITNERLRTGDWFGVRAPTPYDDLLVRFPVHDPNSYSTKYGFTGQHVDKMIPMMYRINYRQLQEALHILMKPAKDDANKNPDPIRIAADRRRTNVELNSTEKRPWLQITEADDKTWKFDEETLAKRVRKENSKLVTHSIPELSMVENIVWLYGVAALAVQNDAEGKYGGVDPNRDIVGLVARTLSNTNFDPSTLSSRDRLEKKFTATAIGKAPDWSTQRTFLSSHMAMLMAGITIGSEFANRVTQQIKGRMTTDAPIGASWPTVYQTG